MIDIHCHILPGVDDGVRTMDEALELIRMEVSGGTKIFVATPHVIDRRDYDRLEAFAERLGELRETLAREGVAAEVVMGGEIYPTPHMIRGFDAGRPLTLGGKGRHMLVDLPMGALPNDLGSLLFELQARGVTPILAHPERVAPFQQNPDGLQEYLERGVAIQVNAGSLLGRYGPHAARTARLLLARRWAHFLASDGHRPGRHPILGSGIEALVGELDEAYLTLLSVGSATCALAGQPLPERPAPPSSETKGWLARLFARG